MVRGKVKDAIRILSQEDSGGVLKPSDIVSADNKTTLEILREKHSPSQSPHPETLVPQGDPDTFSNSIFQALDVEAIRRTVLRVRGSAGPSSDVAGAWRRWCTECLK